MGCQLVLVIDASLWIDLEKAALLDEAFRLPVRWAAPDMVVDELAQPPAEEVLARGLQSVELSGKQIQEVRVLREKYRAPGTEDLSALVLAKSLGTTLLTGNRHLREAAEAEGVSVHGTLWLLDELIDQDIIDEQGAAQALEAMLAEGSRLPPDECERRLRQWKRRQTRNRGT